MNLEQLKQLLEQGLITQEAYQILSAQAQLNISESQIDGSVITGRVDAGGDVIGRDFQRITVEAGATVIFDSASKIQLTAIKTEHTLARYIHYVIAQNRYLMLQGIGSRGNLPDVELDQIYITLHSHEGFKHETEDVNSDVLKGKTTINDILSMNRRLVVLGRPGSGKTTLLRYLALIYAKDMAEDSGVLFNKLNLLERKFIPILVHLRDLGYFLRNKPTLNGHKTLLEFFIQSLNEERIEVPLHFFDEYLNKGEAIILFDGLDEIGNTELTRRIIELIEKFTRAYPLCRYVVTCRENSYKDICRVKERYTVSYVQDFSIEDVSLFLNYWYRIVTILQWGNNNTAIVNAQQKAKTLLQAIETNPRIRALAINPLLLTVIALIYQNKVKLPERRVELYEEAINVLLGQWDVAKGIKPINILADSPFDLSDRKELLQKLALYLHEQQTTEIDIRSLVKWLINYFQQKGIKDEQELPKIAKRFLLQVEERTGLLVAREQRIYSFSHTTFQEYLAATEITGRDDYLKYTLAKCGEDWWREVMLLVAGHFSSRHSPERTNKFIEAISNAKNSNEPYYGLVLATDCIKDIDGRVMPQLREAIAKRFQETLEKPASLLDKVLGRNSWVETRGAMVKALWQAGRGYWFKPFGEPEWIEIPEGKFLLGKVKNIEGKEVVTNRHINRFFIARVPITNAQYALFVKATNHNPPNDWLNGVFARGKEFYPVVNVSLEDAMAYCNWLTKVTGKVITLPSEYEWEKAARGTDNRNYPWGNKFLETNCNSKELQLQSPTPVGIFPGGASPYGVLDMVGNVWEWMRAFHTFQHYQKPISSLYILKGGSWADLKTKCEITANIQNRSTAKFPFFGFRVCIPSYVDDIPNRTSGGI